MLEYDKWYSHISRVCVSCEEIVGALLVDRWHRMSPDAGAGPTICLACRWVGVGTLESDYRAVWEEESE